MLDNRKATPRAYPLNHMYYVLGYDQGWKGHHQAATLPNSLLLDTGQKVRLAPVY